jgi:ketosteroid isomerase-like protein
LRATTLWRRENGEWRIALRHADPVTEPRARETIIDA